MSKVKRQITITEYQSLYNKRDLSDNDFKNLENFILHTRSKSSDNSEIMEISYRKGIGKLITAKNYVGIISLKSGTVIEILPKICKNSVTDVDKSKEILFKMLSTVCNIPYKSLHTANMKSNNCNIFEVFIKIFIDEVFAVAKRGLKSGYVTRQDNLNVFKGRIKFSEHIRYNHSHRERCFSEFDEFDIDRPENKLIKSTLLFLYGKTTSQKNKMDLRHLLNLFENVSESANYSNDFSKCTSDRNMKDYKNVMIWCRIFLNKNNLSIYSGTEEAFAILFPMEKLFEEYIARLVKKELPSSDYNVIAQDNRNTLFDELEINNKPADLKMLFRLKPDIVVEDKNTHCIWIFDTKWKSLYDKPDKNYFIKSQDMYQMFAYHKRYSNVQSVTMLYPKSCVGNLTYKANDKANDKVTVNIRFIDLSDETPMLSIIDELNIKKYI